MLVQDLFDWGWVIGFLEGEGSFYATPSIPGGKKYPLVQAQQVEREPMERLRVMLGGTLWRQRKVYGSHRNPQWVWCLKGRKAATLMREMYAKLSPRRQKQITTVLETTNEVI